MAFPATWRRRLWGVALGGFILQAGNLVRVVSLYYVSKHGSQWVFDAMHEEVWQFLFIALAMVCFLWWVRKWATP